MRPALLAVLLALGTYPESAAADDAARFDAHGCRSCHRIGVRGGDSGPDLTMVGHRRPSAWLEVWLKSPRAFKRDTLMPEQGLSESDLKALVEFLSAQKGRAWGDRRPWDMVYGAEQGKLIYSRAGCVACHGPAGRGGHLNPGAHGDIIPALRPLMGTYTAKELKTKLRRGVVPEVHAGPPAAVNMPAWEGVLSDSELDALVEYLLTLAETPTKGDW